MWIGRRTHTHISKKSPHWSVPAKPGLLSNVVQPVCPGGADAMDQSPYWLHGIFCSKPPPPTPHWWDQPADIHSDCSQFLLVTFIWPGGCWAGPWILWGCSYGHPPMPLHHMGDLYPYLSKTESPSRNIGTRYWSHQLEKSRVLLCLRNNRVLTVRVRATKLLWTCQPQAWNYGFCLFSFFFKHLCFTLFFFLTEVYFYGTIP